jgi:hypothetical protein
MGSAPKVISGITDAWTMKGAGQCAANAETAELE